jgi:hypothetical protein
MNLRNIIIAINDKNFMENVESIIPIQKGSEEYLALFSGDFY